MAKSKTPTVVNRHIYTRASYLYQAADYLVKCQNPGSTISQDEPTKAAERQHEPNVSDSAQMWRKASSNTARQMLAEMRSMTLKAQVRQSPDMKRTVCKYCDSKFVEGQTSRSYIENASKGGRKPWADVLVIECQICENVKRFPVSALRQKRRHLRSSKAHPDTSVKPGKQDMSAVPSEVTKASAED